MLKLYLLKEPRSLILTSNEFALIFKQQHQSTSTSRASSSSVIVDFLPLNEVNLNDAILLYDGKVSGILGLLEVGGDTFLTVITSSNTLGSNSKDFTGIYSPTISCIQRIEFPCLTSNIYDYSTISSPLDASTDAYDDYSTSRGSNSGASSNSTQELMHPCDGVRRILSNGHFYFSSIGNEAPDLTTRLEKTLERHKLQSQQSIEDDNTTEELEEEEYDPRFLWNSFLISSILDFRASLTPMIRKTFDQQAYLALAIQGYAGVYDLNIAGEPVVLTLISRLGVARAGTRFNVRGIDDSGETANFVETETILRTSSMCFSYVQIRGSVPVFWEETGLPFGLKITITRPIESSLPAFLKHFESLLDNYSSIHIVNLLSSKDQEVLLTESYQANLSAAKLLDDDFRSKIEMSNFDFHSRVKLGGIESIKSQLASVVGQVEELFGSCLISVDSKGDGSLIMAQRGVFRTNCKDCLDRTGVVQDMLSRFALEDFIKNANPQWSNSDLSLWSAHRVLFAENGDALSKMYAGTGALNTSFTRSGKKTFAGLLSDASKSVGRMYQSTFLDGGKQTSIDILLGQLSTSQKVRVFNPINDALRISLNNRSSEFTTFKSVSIHVGSYNLNGKSPTSESILPWLFPTLEEPDIIVLGFQELVNLTPTMIVATDPEKKRKWESHILETIANRSNKKSEYILLRSGQLVGTALIILIKTSVVGNIKNVEVASKKTGLKGMAGNKGAVAIRLDYCDTSFCFLTAHLAAGHSNVDERNSDYFTIADGLHFSKGKNIASHDNVIWAADTNYRISLPNEEVRQLAMEDDYATLLQADQLLQSMKTKRVFAEYSEGPLLFKPTYKYDNGTQTYDSSEKQRIPAWTDRILFAGKGLDLSRYNRAELLSSDHRPIYATLRAKIKIIDSIKKSTIRKNLLAEIKVDPTYLDNIGRNEKLSKSITAASLPPPSDDNQAWFDDSSKIPSPVDSSLRNLAITNPFESGYILPSPSTVRTPSRSATLPPVLPPRISTSNTSRSVPSLPPRKSTLDNLQLPPPIPRRPNGMQRSNSNTSNGEEVSLLDSEDEGNLKNWEVIKA